MANECFHILYHQGIWLDRQLASVVLEKGYVIPDTQLNLAKFTVSRVFYADKFDEVLLPLMKKTELYIYMGLWATKEGYSAAARLCSDLGWHLFKVRPKLHLLVEIWILVRCIFIMQFSHHEVFFTFSPVMAK